MDIFKKAKLAKIDIFQERNRIDTILSQEVSYYSITLVGIIQNHFQEWPYRNGCVSLKEYIEIIGADDSSFYKSNPPNPELFLEYCQLIINLVFFVRRNNFAILDKNTELRKPDVLEKTIEAVTDNIQLFLDKNNYSLHSIDAEQPKIEIVSKDPEAELAVDNLPSDYQEKIFEYLAFSNKNNLDKKQAILTYLNKYLDDNHPLIKDDTTKSLENFKFLINSLGVRHGDEYTKESEKLCQYVDSSNSRNDLYDNAFSLFIRGINTSNNNKILEDIKKLKVNAGLIKQ